MVDVIEGALAQLGERLNGIQKVGGSIPPSSTRKGGLAMRPFKIKTDRILIVINYSQLDIRIKVPRKKHGR